MNVKFIEFDFKDINEEISLTMDYQEQPHGDSSFIALRKICEEVSKYEKVTLTGDGADEIFGGYDYYFQNDDIDLFSLWKRLRFLIKMKLKIYCPQILNMKMKNLKP